MYSLLVDLKRFSAAHRLVKGYRGKCNHLHGHNYTLKVKLVAESVGEDGLVVDFAVVRDICDGWVQRKLDHATLVYCEDLPLLDFLRQQQQKHYQMQSNTTVECLAAEIYQQLFPLLTDAQCGQTSRFCLQQVHLWESDDCAAVYTGD